MLTHVLHMSQHCPGKGVSLATLLVLRAPLGDLFEISTQQTKTPCTNHSFIPPAAIPLTRFPVWLSQLCDGHQTTP